MTKSDQSDNKLILGDLNARVDNLPIPKVVGQYGEQTINENGDLLRQFSLFNKLKIVNTFFRKKDIHKFTWTARETRSIIDYVIANKKIAKQITDVTVHRESEPYVHIFRPFPIVIGKIDLYTRWKKQKQTASKTKTENVYKIYQLENEDTRLRYQNKMLHLYNMCWKKLKIPRNWKKSKIIQIFKKGSRSECGNYRGISLLNSGYKLYARMINNRLKITSEHTLGEEQMGLRKGRSTTDAIFTIRQIIEKRREFNQETHIAFIDFEKAFDNLNRKQLWEIMEHQGYPQHLKEAVKSLYNNTSIVLDL